MDAEHKPVWTYGVDEGLQHPISAQRLPNGKHADRRRAARPA